MSVVISKVGLSSFPSDADTGSSSSTGELGSSALEWRIEVLCLMLLAAELEEEFPIEPEVVDTRDLAIPAHVAQKQRS